MATRHIGDVVAPRRGEFSSTTARNVTKQGALTTFSSGNGFTAAALARHSHVTLANPVTTSSATRAQPCIVKFAGAESDGTW